MSTRTRALCVIAVAQAACVAGGGWMHHRSLVGMLADKQAAAALAQSTLGIDLIAGLWTWALSVLATYLVVARILENLERRGVQASNEALWRTQHLIRTRDAVIFGLAKLADSRDPETGDHLDRIAEYSTTLANAMRTDPRYAECIDTAFVRLIGVSSALHDIGKVGIRDGILLKPGPLTDVEHHQMQMHATIGAECLRNIERRLGTSNFLQMAREIALAHHEHWDGSGYPQTLAGEEIPLAARIVAVADTYDALSSRRVYKEPLAHETCMQMIAQQAGRHFDPHIVAIWLRIDPEIRALARRHRQAAQAVDNDNKKESGPPAGGAPVAPPETIETLREELSAWPAK